MKDKHQALLLGGVAGLILGGMAGLVFVYVYTGWLVPAVQWVAATAKATLQAWGLWVPINVGNPVTLAILGGALVAGTIAGIAWLTPSSPVHAIEINRALTRDGGPGTTSVDDVIDAVEDADADEDVHALLLVVDSPGGPVGASSDLATAIETFDGPTVALAEDTCASGGYMAAAACDHVVARPHSLVGSIGVTGSRANYRDLLDDLGIDRLDLTAGEHKEAGHPMAEVDDDEVAYLQGLIDAFYDQFVDHVTQYRDVDDAVLREDVGARVLVGGDAVDAGLADAVGDRDDAEAYLADELDDDLLRDAEADQSPVPTRDVTPSSPFAAIGQAPGRVAAGAGRLAARTAFAFGRGLGSALGDHAPDVRDSLPDQFDIRYK